MAALLVLSWSERASAAARPSIPMCGERNESVAAPPIFRAQGSASISAGPCHSDELRLGKSLPLAPELRVVPDKPERVLSLAALGLARSAGMRLSVPPRTEVHDLPGHPGLVFRPPRS